MPLRMHIDHNGQALDVEVCWEAVDAEGIHGLYFEVDTVNERTATQVQIEELDESLCDRYAADAKFRADIYERAMDYEIDRRSMSF